MRQELFLLFNKDSAFTLHGGMAHYVSSPVKESYKRSLSAIEEIVEV